MIIIINSFLFHYYRNDNKLQIYLRLEGKQKYQREAKANVQCVITEAREQCRDTVHLFIGTGCNLRKIFKSVRPFILRFVFVRKLYRQ
jgi:hypothetical protein